VSKREDGPERQPEHVLVSDPHQREGRNGGTHLQLDNLAPKDQQTIYVDPGTSKGAAGADAFQLQALPVQHHVGEATIFVQSAAKPGPTSQEPSFRSDNPLRPWYRAGDAPWREPLKARAEGTGSPNQNRLYQEMQALNGSFAIVAYEPGKHPSSVQSRRNESRVTSKEQREEPRKGLMVDQQCQNESIRPSNLEVTKDLPGPSGAATGNGGATLRAASSKLFKPVNTQRTEITNMNEDINPRV